MQKNDLIALYNELAELKIRYVIYNIDTNEILKNLCYNKRMIIQELNTIAAVTYFEETLVKIVQENLENNHNFDTINVSFTPLIIIPEEEYPTENYSNIPTFKDVLPIIMNFKTNRNHETEEKYTSKLYFVDKEEFKTSLKALGYEFDNEKYNSNTIPNIKINFPPQNILIRKKDA